MSGPAHQKQVAALRNGTVVDHLDAGMALKALQALGMPKDRPALLGIHLESRKMGRKDILKLDGTELTPAQMARLAVFGPHATVSVIREYAVVQKVEVQLPDTVEGLIRCPNPACVTNHEKVPTKFDVECRAPVRARCRYCERRLLGSEFDVK